MNLLYIAAEYFVDAISISPDYKINFDYVKILRNLIGKDIDPSVAKYLDKKSKHDFLYIFKKFPDVFTVEDNTIGLTKAFLSLYCLGKNLVSKRFYFINCYTENCAIEYFRKILVSHGPKPYLELFNILMADDTQKFAKYFFHFSVTQMLDFFRDHSNYFTVIHNNIVILNVRKPIQSYSLASNQDDLEAMKMFEISVYFLLTCFKSLHYLHIKQCLSYVAGSTKRILEQISLVRQRELFAVLPVVTMDAFGFLTLKAEELIFMFIALPDIVKTILLIVCILAFKKEMHIADLITEFSDRMPPSTIFFPNLNLQEQIDFIKKYPSYFHISHSRHISLLPEFLLPECSFGQSSEYVDNLQIAKGSIKSTDDNQLSDESNVTEDCNFSNSVSSNMLNKSSIHITNTIHEGLLQNADSLPESTYVICLFGVPETVIERIKQSFLYLSNFFYPLDKKRAMKTLLHAVDDVRISFCSFPDKCKFIRVCCDFIKSLSIDCLENKSDSIGELITEKEQNLLFAIYMLTVNESEYFLRIIDTMREHKIDNNLVRSTPSDQIRYFKRLNSYINVYSDGQIIFTLSYFPIKSIIDSYPDLFSDSENISTETVSQNENSSIKVVSQNEEPSSLKIPEDKKTSRTFVNKSDKHSKTLSWVTSVVPQECKCSKTFEDDVESPFIKTSVSLPHNICKILSHCTKLLSKYYEYAAAIHILKATLFSFTDVYNYLFNLPVSDQYVFVEKCFKFINKEKHHRSNCITTKEREILFITYLLLDGSEHYRKIIIELNACNCKRLFSMPDRSQYWYFRNAEKYFLINSDGFVSLNSSFTDIDVIVNAAVNHSAKHQCLSKKSTHKTENVHKNNPEQCISENMAVSLPTQNSPNYSSINIQERSSQDEELESSPNAINADGGARSSQIEKLDANPNIINDDAGARSPQIEKLEANPNKMNIDADARDVVIDVMFFILSICEKMSIEKLCHRLNSCSLKGVSNIFSSYTINEKLNFFKNLSVHFVVSKDGFVSLNKDAAETFVPKTNINLSELLKKSNSVPEKSPTMPRDRSESMEKSSIVTRIRSESVKSTGTSEVSVSVSNASVSNVSKRRRTRRHSKKKYENNHNKVSYEIHKVIDDTYSPKKISSNYLTLKASCIVENTIETASFSVSNDNECNAIKNTNENGQLSESISDNIVEINEIENVVLLSGDDDDCMIVDEITEVCDEKKEEKSGESLSKLMASSLEKAKKYSLSVSEGLNKLKAPRQPFTESVSSKLYKSSLTLFENNSVKNGTVDSSVNNFNKIPFINDSLTPSETSEVKHDLSNLSACETLTLSDNENLLPSKETEEDLQRSSLLLSDSCHNDLEKDSSYKTYISDLIDEFLYSAKTKSLDTETSDLNKEHKNVSSSDNDDTSKPNSSLVQSSTNEQQSVNNKNPGVKVNSSSSSTSELKNEQRNLHKCTKVPDQKCDKICDVPKEITLDKSELPSTHKVDSISEKSVYCDTIVEDRAVTFYSLMLKKYQQYDDSICVDFLKKLIFHASSEVQSFMLKHYGHDFLPFFQKHNKLFYVSPITHCVYLSRKSSQKLRLNLS